MTHSYFDAAQELKKNGQSFVVVTLIDGRGHIPQDKGAKILVTEDGLYWGTIGGGKIEAQAMMLSQKWLCQETSHLDSPITLTWNLQKDLGMTCGGEVTLFFEKYEYEPIWKIAIFGAGHVGQSLVSVLRPLSCHLTVIDSRQEWIDKIEDHPFIKKVRVDDLSSYASQLSAEHFFVIVTQGHATDASVLLSLSHYFPEAPYVGVIGSSVKALKIKEMLLEQSVSPDFVERLFLPIGLPFGNNQPYEIALSIAGQLIQQRDQLK